MTDAPRKRAEIVAPLLEMVAAGEMTAVDALDKWPDLELETDDVIVVAWHDLSHFAADADIRERDPEYNTYQRDLLREKAAKIRERYQLT